MSKLQSLNGFRDFAPADCAVRNYLFSVWKKVAQSYGFLEYEGPIVEHTELYLKKSGGEIAGQLFRFEDQGGRDIALRPEVTPSLARLIAQRQREFPKPMKWFQMGQCFRYERPQKGRTREFYQYNVDIAGEAGVAADAEVVALAIDVMRAFGFQQGEFVVRLSSRAPWTSFCQRHNIADLEAFLSIIDKWEKLRPEQLESLLTSFPVSQDDVTQYMEQGDELEVFEPLLKDLRARGMEQWVQVDLSIVRGLAYYTGYVFEVFDLKHGMRAVAGGGRYDNLVATMSDQSVDLPMVGFGMGDVVIGNLIEATPQAALKMEAALRQDPVCEVYVAISSEEKRAEALPLIAALRQAGYRVDYPLSATKLGKQLQRAEQQGARYALLIEEQFPLVRLKSLLNRTEETLPYDEHFLSLLASRFGEIEAGMIA